LYSDMANYARYADELRSGPLKAIHFFQPIGLPSIIFVFKGLFLDWRTALGVYQVLASTATVWLVWRTADKAFGPWVGILSLTIATFHVPWVVLATVALPETTFAFLLAVLARLGIEVVERESPGWSALWGLVFIAAFFVKGSHGFFGPMFLAALLGFRGWSRDVIRRVAVPISLVVGTGLLLHGTLTYRAIGTFQMVSSEGGLNFMEGKCPSKINMDSAGAQWFSPLYAQLGRTEAKQWDRPFTDSDYYIRAGLACIRERPAVVVTALEGIPFLFVGNTLWPASQFPTAPFTRAYDAVFGMWMMVGLAVSLWRLWPSRSAYQAFVAWMLPLAALCLCVYVFKSEIRFRVPFDVWLIPAAVAGWWSIVSAWRQRHAALMSSIEQRS